MKTDNPAQQKRATRRGFGLVLVLGFTAILIVFTAAIAAQASFNLHTVTHRGQTERAHYAANTGIHLAMSILKEPPPTVGNWLEENRAYLRVFKDGTESSSKVFHNIDGLAGAQLTAPDGTDIPPDHFYIIALGIVNGEYDVHGDLISGVKVQATTMGATITPNFPPLPQAAYAYETLAIHGRVGHFDSRTSAAPYDAATDVLAYPSGFPVASVATQSTDHTEVEIGDTARIDGHVLMGVGTAAGTLNNLLTSLNPPTPTITDHTPQPQYGMMPATPINSGHPLINGVISRLPSDRGLIQMVPDDPSIYAQVFPSGSTVGSGGIRELEEGRVYLQEGNLVVSGTGILRVVESDGDPSRLEDTILLVEGDVRFTDATVNAENAPRSLKIYSLGGGGATDFVMTNSQANCLVAGREMDVAVDETSQLWGAVMGQEITLAENGAIHYDVALRDPRALADIYGYYILASTVSSGAGVPTSGLAPEPAPAPAAPAGPAAGPAPAPTGGGGCGCGGGSMFLALKEMQMY